MRFDTASIEPRMLAHGRHGRDHVIWDEALFDALPDPSIFEPAYWQACDAILSSATGRGEAYFVDAGAPAPWVLRHYRRGGLLAHVNRDRYLWLAPDRTRPFREFALLSCLHDRGLSVPWPIAARAHRRGGFYTADLITVAVADARPLAEHLMNAPVPSAAWRACGQAIARLHAEQVWHADLNARNLLLGEDNTITILDFDRARILRRSGRGWRESNLARLRRSLDKFVARQSRFCFEEADWSELLAAYRTGYAAVREDFERL